MVLSGWWWSYKEATGKTQVFPSGGEGANASQRTMATDQAVAAGSEGGHEEAAGCEGAHSDANCHSMRRGF